MQMEKNLNAMEHRYKPYSGPTCENNDGVSLTVPDQAMSMREILDRFARGIPFEAGKVPIWSEEDDLDESTPIDFNRLDLAEKEAIGIEVGRTLREHKKRKEAASKSQPEPSAEPAANTPT